MTEIEQRTETTGRIIEPDYSGMVFTAAQIERGAHRKFVGGMWDVHGARQLDFLIAQGLKPAHKLLDVGCGSFRAGRHIVNYLEPGNYYGIDANLTLLQAGYDVELTDEERSRLPVKNLRANDRFDADFGVKFDMAIAQSVFTHVSLNHIRLCLVRVARVMHTGGKFYATFFEQGSDVSVDTIAQEGSQRPRFTERNLFWYFRSDLEWASTFGPWDYKYIGDWGHPRGQCMVEYTRRLEPGSRPADMAPPQSGSALGRVTDFARRIPKGGRRWIAARRR